MLKLDIIAFKKENDNINKKYDNVKMELNNSKKINKDLKERNDSISTEYELTCELYSNYQKLFSEKDEELTENIVEHVKCKDEIEGQNNDIKDYKNIICS